jgi:RNA polymerase sigma factor (sigma-70 family)
MNEDMIRYVKAASEGDTDAMARLYSGTLKVSYFLALKLTGNAAEAVDVTKKAYARAFCTITKLKKPEAFEIWMKQNIASVYKETQKFVFEDAEGSVPESNMEFLSESVFDEPDKAVAAVSAADSLKPEYRTAIILHYFSGMPVASLAKQLGVSESTVNALLAHAKEKIAEACDSGEPDIAPVGTLPVLTRLLQNQMEVTGVPAADVKDIFVYAMEIYNSFKHVEDVKANGGTEENSYFKAKPSAPVNAGPVVPSKLEPAVPSKPAVSSDPGFDDTESKIDFDTFVDEPIQKPVQKKGFMAKLDTMRIGNISVKRLGILVVAVIMLIIIIVAIAKGCSKNDSGSTSTNSGSSTVSTASADLKEGDYSWVPGGFEDCTDIQYLDENCCVFKSATTGKYGLLDYQGNVLLQPNYDGFVRCGFGRDYENSGQYHTLVTIEGEQYYVSISNGTAIISESPHGKHGITPQELDKDVKYDERDRYFEGYAAAEKNGKWGYVSQETDKKVIPYEYEAVNNLTASDASACDYCRPFNNGLVAVKKDGMMGIINTNNDTIVPFEYSNIMVGDDGVFIACKDGTWGVILVGNAINTFSGVNIVISDTTTGTDDTAAPETDESKTYICVADSGINIRSGPGGSYDDIGDLASGEEVEGYETKTAEDSGKTWLKIAMGDGSYGWVAMSYMQEA